MREAVAAPGPPARRALAILSLVGCLAARPSIASPSHAAVADDLLQHWVHSSEEERAGDSVEIYRPAESRIFPPSRFRMAYKFAAKGACEFYFLSPDDNHRFKACTWSASADDPAILRIVEDGTTTSFKVVELSRKILRLKRLE